MNKIDEIALRVAENQLFPHPAPVIASEQKPIGFIAHNPGGCHEGSSIPAAPYDFAEFYEEIPPPGSLLFTSPPNTADIEQRVAEAFVMKFKRHVGGDGEFWLHELEDFCEDGKWREYL